MTRPNPVEEIYFSEEGDVIFVPTCQARTIKAAMKIAENYDQWLEPDDIWTKRKVKVYNGQVGDESVYAGKLMCWVLGEATK